VGIGAEHSTTERLEEVTSGWQELYTHSKAYKAFRDIYWTDHYLGVSIYQH